MFKEIFGADGVDHTNHALKQITQHEELCFGNLPTCVANTQHSFSCDATAKGAPTDFRITVR